ncbi:uncharacterized protein LOC118806512 [Colossoma macropomum]|uniref:uncharacterized protein LOC118806512 n=1 Tax=Colossoma macropomum TaxID=42526 RepID=UPI0018652BF4|nr:uncharacterized protein LOC118806512 [Colossoma macropomum]
MEMKMSCVCLVLGLVLLMTVFSDATVRLDETARAGVGPKVSVAVGSRTNKSDFMWEWNEILRERVGAGLKKQSRADQERAMRHFRQYTTPRGRFCKKDLWSSGGFYKEEVRSSSTQQEKPRPPETFRVTTPRARAITPSDQCCLNFVTSKIPEKEIIKVEKTPSDCPKQGYMVTTARGKFCKKEDIMASTTQQQSTVSTTFSVRKAKGKLDNEGRVLASTTQRQSSVSTVSYSVATSIGKLDNEEDVLASTTQQQTSVSTVSYSDKVEDILASTTQQQSTVSTTFSVRKAKGKLDNEGRVLASTTQRQSSVSTVSYSVATSIGKLDNEEDVLASTTQQQTSVSTVSYSDKVEDILASTTQQQSSVSAVSSRATKARGKLDNEQNVLASTTQQQSTESTVSYSVTTARDKLDKEEDILASGTEHHSTQPSGSSRVAAAMSEFCLP